LDMEVCLDLNEAGAPALNPLTVNLLFTCCLFHIMAFLPYFIAYTTKCLTC
jgi:hypothetical protein